MGKAIVASDVGEVRRMVGDAGIIVGPGNPKELARGVLEILGDTGLKKKCGNFKKLIKGCFLK